MSRSIRILLIVQLIISLSEGKYDIDIIEVDWNITTTDAIDIKLKSVQPKRGIFAINGYIELKEDVRLEASLSQVKIYYSSRGQVFQLSPFRVPEQTATSTMNGPYRIYVMDRMQECCENAPYGDIIESPITKRKVTFNNCQFPTDTIPPTMRLGYYRLVIMVYGDIEFNLSILLKLDLA
ncbi:uncharacterized protein LOC142226887 [Haematobia irritans]|uniref:uncharacterized protein LOC142226887 n=1 Tax=Haematobia irritans TaxID=7368 RepID=UPI003F504ACD